MFMLEGIVTTHNESIYKLQKVNNVSLQKVSQTVLNRLWRIHVTSHSTLPTVLECYIFGHLKNGFMVHLDETKTQVILIRVKTLYQYTPTDNIE